MPNTRNSEERTITPFVNEWSIDKSCKTKFITTHKPKQISQHIQALCDEFFLSKVSELSDCFSRVPREYFHSMCLNGTSKKEACMAAVSYLDMCSYVYTPMRIPDTCVQ